MTDEPIRTGAIPNCQCHQRIAQLESALEVLSENLMAAEPEYCLTDDCRQLESTDPWDEAKCIQCWIDWAMEEAKK